jgi:putative sugar O-methyltransferase
LKVILHDSPDFIQQIDQFKINDMVGTPVTFSYSYTGSVSPTTLLYLKVASDLRKLFGDLNGKKIVEIGVGYGGQLPVLDHIYRISQYHLFDLQPVLTLTQRCLQHHILNSSYKLCTLNQCDGLDSYYLAISNYAFSELPTHIQVKYIKKVLSKSARGYLTMNSGKGPAETTINRLTLEQLHTLLPPFQVLDECPLTGANNYILVWGQS